MKIKSKFHGLLECFDENTDMRTKVLIIDVNKIISGGIEMVFDDDGSDDEPRPFTLTIHGTGNIEEYYAGDGGPEALGLDAVA